MIQHSLKSLEFDKVVNCLASRASSDLGRALSERLAPVETLETAQLRLLETGEAREILERFGHPPFHGTSDVRGLIRRAGQGSVLSPEELVIIRDTLSAGRRVKAFFARHETGASRLGSIARRIPLLTELEGLIERTVSKEGDVLDGASPKLSAIRSQKRLLGRRIRDRLEEIIKSPEDQRYLQDQVVSIREGRYVIPVKAEHRSKVPGIVHDRSSSGATLFVEPMSIVTMNNELKVLTMEERSEVDRILGVLSRAVGSLERDIELLCDLVGELDLAFAKAKLSQEMDASEPELNSEGVLFLKGARHPLLKGKVVPIDIRLGLDFDTLLITGPNTGGKTVALKTAGLISLMAAAGLHVPVSPGSRVSIFNGIYCDIGDEQSIEQSLSTFSAHMKNVVQMVREAGRNSLVLLDEIGAGTDPAEGTALAMALLEHFQLVGAKTIATSHFGELKAFVFSQERMENASVVFDVDTLLPTYELRIGLPGSSNALEVASRLGLPNAVKERAASYLGKDRIRLDGLINDVAMRQEELARLLDEAEKHRRRALLLEEQLRERLEAIDRREREVISQAREKAEEIIRSTARKANELMRKIRKAEMMGPDKRGRWYAEAAREAFDREAGTLLSGDTGESGKTSLVDEGGGGSHAGNGFDRTSQEATKRGMKVFVRSIGQSGTLVDIGEGEARVQIGSLRFLVDLDEIRPVKGSSGGEEGHNEVREGTLRGSAGGSALSMDKARTVAPEIMLRGLEVEEALRLADKYLDDAYLAGLKSVKIVHGKGTGALRKAIQGLLANHPHVESYRIGEKPEGGEGVTVAELRV